MIKKWIDHIFGDFCKSLKIIQYDEEGDLDYRSFSWIAQRMYADPERDFEQINKLMEKYGWSLEKSEELMKNLKKLKSNFPDILLQCSSCGVLDYYLYKLTDGEFPLGGYKWEDGFWGEEENSEELNIKFSYGWHLTRYGKLCIEQNMSMKDFLKGNLDSILGQFIVNIIRNNNKIINNRHLFNDFNQSFYKEMNHFIIDMDGIYVDVDGFYEYYANKLSQFPHLSRQEFNNKFYEYLENQKISFDKLSDDDVKIKID